MFANRIFLTQYLFNTLYIIYSVKRYYADIFMNLQTISMLIVESSRVLRVLKVCKKKKKVKNKRTQFRIEFIYQKAFLLD